MKFELKPVLSTMATFYEQTRDRKRFEAYLFLLQGQNTGDMILPIGGYNPMAKGHLLQKIQILQAIAAEDIAAKSLAEVNATLTDKSERTIQVVLNVADDLKGAWTNRYTTDFDAKFKLNAFVTRNLCTPYFWSSESYTPALIHECTLASAYRTLYWLQHPNPKTLAEHIQQEIFVQRQLNLDKVEYTEEELQSMTEIHEAFQEEEDYNLLFNFFYGDAICEGLGYPKFGVQHLDGFKYARILAME